jgi:dihydrofolate reductase
MKIHRKVILYIATSLDGFIAPTNGDMSFLSVVAQEGEDYGYADFVSMVDTVIMGRITYDWVMTQVKEFSHADKESYIITHTEKPNVGKTHFYTGDLKDLIVALREKNGKNIFIDGGASIVNQLLKERLIDEFYISIIPVLLGSGVRLFQEGQPPQNLQLVRVKHYPKGLVQIHYQKIEETL